MVRINTETDIERVTAIRKAQLIQVQAQLEGQLKNIREQRYEQIEKTMRKCEGGRAGGSCPELDCSLCSMGK